MKTKIYGWKLFDNYNGTMRWNSLENGRITLTIYKEVAGKYKNMWYFEKNLWVKNARQNPKNTTITIFNKNKVEVLKQVELYMKKHPQKNKGEGTYMLNEE